MELTAYIRRDSMFNNWDIPDGIFSVHPVTRSTLENFVGRQSIVKELQKSISRKNSVVIIEGEIGTGKTSLGNFIRFTQPKSFSTNMEIMCHQHWGPKELLLALQSAILSTCEKEFNYSGLLDLDEFKRIYERNKNIRLSDYQVQINVLGAGVGGGTNRAISQPIHLDDQILLTELDQMIQEIKKRISKRNKFDIDEARIIFQLNNLDPNEPPFTEEKIVVFLNSVRDLITTKIDASFIINGGDGLKSLITNKIRRLSDSSRIKTIQSLTLDEVLEVLGKRIENQKQKGDIPFERELINKIYLYSNGNFRKILWVMNELAEYFDTEEILIKKISFNDCLNFFFLNYQTELGDISLNLEENLTTKGKIIKFLSENPGSNINQIEGNTGIKQSNVSTNITELAEKGFVIKFKGRDGVSINCYLLPEYAFASKYFFSKIKDG